jgi:hypothetical protein
MRFSLRLLILLTLVACAGCTRASDARVDHILAGPHGWIDVTLHAPAPVGAASAAEGAPPCSVAFHVNDESLLSEVGVTLAQADAAKSPIGYRFVVPAGTLATDLTISNCVKSEIHAALPVTLEKDHLALLAFDGKALALTSNEPYQPATLDTLRGDVAALHDHGTATDGALSMLTKLVAVGLLLNVVVLVVALRRRNR